jgi:hypothetical protein
MRTRLAAIAAIAAIIALGASPAALAASTARHDRAAGAVRPSVTNPGDAEPSLSLSVSPAGEPEIATIGPSHSLWFSYFSGVHWNIKKISGKDTAYSAPSLIAGSGGISNVAVEGASHTLQFWHRSGGRWHRTQVAGKGSTYSAPSLAEGDGKTAIAAEGSKRKLVFYAYRSGKWHRHVITRNGVVASAPSLVIRSSAQASGTDPAGEADIAVGESGGVLFYYNSLDTGWQATPVTGAGVADSAPSLAVSDSSHSTGAEPFIALEGPGHLLYRYVEESGIWEGGSAAGPGAVYSAPSQVIGDSVVFDPMVYESASRSLRLVYTDLVARTVASAVVSVDFTAYSPPSLFVQPSGELDVAAQGQDNSLMYCAASAPVSPATPGFSCTQVGSIHSTYGG